MGKLYNMKAVYPLVNTLYGIAPEEDQFEDEVLAGWDLLGNRHTKLYRYVGNTVNRELELPCNVAQIESVHVPINDAQMTSNKEIFNEVSNLYVENYIDAWYDFDNPLNSKGKLIDYREADNVLYFDKDYSNVKVIYHGILVDDETGLPMINDKEMKALAAYVAYIELQRDGFKKRDANALQLANIAKADWLQKCNAARTPEYLSQNDMNTILDVKTRWDRKCYSRSYKPIL